MADRSVRFASRLREELGITDRAERFIAAHGDHVRGGPFVGLRYWAVGDAPIPKLLGCYEAEILPWIERAIASAPRRFVDIGAADGYYAVGFAKRGIPVDAFEMSPLARRRCRELAQRNGVAIALHGRATASRLRALDLEGAFVLSDCEGAEADLFTPRVVSGLATATVVVELHERARPGVTELLRGRFAPSHDYDVVRVGSRDAERHPELAVLDAGERDDALSEMRHEHDAWALCSPRRRAG